MSKRSSGLDFSDSKAMDSLSAHPDVQLNRAPSTALQRNNTERRRLHGVMRDTVPTDGRERASQIKDTKLMDRYHTWLINGGRRRLIFGFYIFLHALVWAFGFLHYQLKDSSAGVRALVGLGFPFARTAALVLHVDVTPNIDYQPKPTPHTSPLRSRQQRKLRSCSTAAPSMVPP